jgi:hypothetical protein
VVCKMRFPDLTRDFKKPCLKYGMESHVLKAHPGFATPGNLAGKLIPRDMAEALDLDPLEEKRMGVQTSTL